MRRDLWSVVVVVLAVVGLVAAIARESDAQLYDTVETHSGPVRGKIDGDVRVWKGIPYAAPPVGELRFASPQDPESWEDTYDAFRYGNICPGLGNVFVGLLPTVQLDEDCLYMNVYAPIRDRIDRPLPVLLWIYGGAFIVGDGYELGLYDGHYIVEQHDVIVVTFNYRLGPLGYFVNDNGLTGNYGIQDQQFAMKWVQRNIAGFGGDPAQVTIFGESAGGMSVSVHVTSELTQGLYSRAIIESNPFGLHYKEKDVAVKVGERLARMVDCEATDNACLRNVTWQRITWQHLPIFPTGWFGEQLIGDILTWMPTVDGIYITDQPRKKFLNNEYLSGVPIMMGTTEKEFYLFSGTIDTVIDIVNAIFGTNITVPLYERSYTLLMNLVFEDDADRVLEMYPPLPDNQNNYDQFVYMLDRYSFHCPSRQVESHLAEMRSDPYVYEFHHVAEYLPIATETNRGCFANYSCHAAELPFLWHADSVSIFPIRMSPEELVLSDNVIGHWVGFASGDINMFDPPVEWPVFDAANNTHLIFDGSGNSIGYFDQGDDCQFWDSLDYKY